MITKELKDYFLAKRLLAQAIEISGGRLQVTRRLNKQLGITRSNLLCAVDGMLSNNALLVEDNMVPVLCYNSTNAATYANAIIAVAKAIEVIRG